ncbi:hypothetical protein E4N76_08450 [Treponema putidum]|uniref:Sulfatase-modifying factor enzyme 1 n=1 Tax=Treponema putidum TaxID=221027 RepID=A0ABY5HXW4_9SPIR|nr:hypothetical protein E4N76_08450 [Treponema putidum]
MYVNTPTGGQDPTGVVYGSDRVERGGAYHIFDANFVARAWRGDYKSDLRVSSIGFRVACRP